MKHLTMQQLHELGFEVEKAGHTDNFMWQRRKNGFIEVETTWKKSGVFHSQEVKITSGWIEMETEKLTELLKILKDETET